MIYTAKLQLNPPHKTAKLQPNPPQTKYNNKQLTDNSPSAGISMEHVRQEDVGKVNHSRTQSLLGRVKKPVTKQFGRVKKPVTKQLGHVKKPVTKQLGRVKTLVTKQLGRVTLSKNLSQNNLDVSNNLSQSNAPSKHWPTE